MLADITPPLQYNPPLDLSSQMRLILMLFRHIHFLKKYHRATGAPLIARENEFFEYFHVFCCPHTSIFRNVTKYLIFKKFYNILELLENLPTWRNNFPPPGLYLSFQTIWGCTSFQTTN